MTPENIVNIINALPKLIIYIVPGYLLIWVKRFILSEKNESTSSILLESIVLSYILIIIVQQIINIFNDNINIKDAILAKLY